MQNIRVLIIYSRDIEINDSGGSRTTLQLANYIAEKEGFECYCLFKILGGNNGRIIEISDKALSKESIREVIIQKNIDILLVPEAYQLAKCAHDAAVGTNCKVVSALHSRPGYERIGLFTMIKESLLYNESYLKRMRALVLILFYPFIYYIYTKNIRHHFKKAYEDSYYLVLLSESFFNQFRDSYKIENIDKLIAIGNSISFNYFASEIDIANKRNQILVVSRLDESQKRISLVLKSWKMVEDRFPDWSLKIVGFGRSLNYYLKMASDLKIKRVDFLGKQQPESFYKDSAIFLMTSAFEGWGMTITEAQQYGCVPIVMESFSAVHDIIQSGYDGIISPDADIESFASNISNLISDDILRKRLAKNGVESVKRFTREIICEKWIDLFRNVVNNKDDEKNNR